MPQEELSEVLQKSKAEALHRWLVRTLDHNPKMAWSDAPPRGKTIVDQLKPMLYELWATDQVTEEEILQVFREVGYPLSLASYRDAMTSRRPTPMRRRTRVRPLSNRRFDMLVLKVGESLGTERLDPRVRLRYLELTGLLPAGLGSATCLLSEVQQRLDEAARRRCGVA